MSVEDGNNTKSQSEKIPVKIAEILPIEQSSGVPVFTREMLRKLVESPLLSACEELYDKNIQTLSTSANQKDIKNGTARIVIDFDSLSDENKEIGRKLGNILKKGDMARLDIEIPVNKNSTAQEIKSLAESIAHKFKKQEMIWAPSYTLEQAREIYGIDPNEEKYGVEAFADLLYYDKERKLFYLSEEHARKVREKT